METPTITSGKDLAANWDKEVRLIGEYYVVDLRPHAIIQTRPDGSVVKVYKEVFLLLEDRTQVSLSTRPEEEMATYDGRQVAIIGTLNEELPPDDPDVAQPSPVPFLTPVQSVELFESS